MSAIKHLALLLFTALFCLKSQANQLVVEHIANAGIKISSGKQVVLIDALFGPHHRFNSLSDEDYAQLVEQSATAVLTSHYHDDHFGAPRAKQFLDANPDTLFVSPPQVMEMFQHNIDHPLLHAPLLSGFQSARFSHQGVNITALNFPHMSPEQTAHVQNYAYIVEINGWKVLHVGDGGIESEIIDGLKLDERDIDVTLVHDLCPERDDCVARLKQIGAQRVGFYHMMNQRAKPVGAWIDMHYPIARMLVTHQAPIVLERE